MIPAAYGLHSGFIPYLTDAAQPQTGVDNLASIW